MAKRYEMLRDQEWLREEYGQKLRSLSEIAFDVGCNTVSVLNALRKYNIPTRTAAETRRVRGTKRRRIYPILNDKEWLNQKYTIEQLSAEDVGKIIGCSHSPVLDALTLFDIPIRNHGPIRPKYSIHKGYKMIRVPNHPYAPKNGWMPEHRLIVEEELGRYLTKEEQIHHLNEEKDDNRLDNLMVFPNNATHMSFHKNPPDWIPLCECCGRPRPELLEKRPDYIPLYYKE